MAVHLAAGDWRRSELSAAKTVLATCKPEAVFPFPLFSQRAVFHRKLQNKHFTIQQT